MPGRDEYELLSIATGEIKKISLITFLPVIPYMFSEPSIVVVSLEYPNRATVPVVTASTTQCM
jgi:hypothetical protein